MTEEGLHAYAQRIVDAMPKPSPEQRRMVAAILRESEAPQR